MENYNNENDILLLFDLARKGNLTIEHIRRYNVNSNKQSRISLMNFRDSINRSIFQCYLHSLITTNNDSLSDEEEVWTEENHSVDCKKSTMTIIHELCKIFIGTNICYQKDKTDKSIMDLLIQYRKVDLINVLSLYDLIFIRSHQTELVLVEAMNQICHTPVYDWTNEHNKFVQNYIQKMMKNNLSLDFLFSLVDKSNVLRSSLDLLSRSVSTDYNHIRNHTDNFGRTLLVYAIYNAYTHNHANSESIKSIQLLVYQFNFRLDTVDFYGYTPLHTACSLPKLNVDVIEALMSKYQVNGCDLSEKYEIINRSVYSNNMFDNSHTNDKNRYNKYGIHSYSVSKQKQTEQQSIDTPLSLAIKNNSWAVAKYLLDNGADIDPAQSSLDLFDLVICDNNDPIIHIHNFDEYLELLPSIFRQIHVEKQQFILNHSIGHNDNNNEYIESDMDIDRNYAINQDSEDCKSDDDSSSFFDEFETEIEYFKQPSEQNTNKDSIDTSPLSSSDNQRMIDTIKHSIFLDPWIKPEITCDECLSSNQSLNRFCVHWSDECFRAVNQDLIQQKRIKVNQRKEFLDYMSQVHTSRTMNLLDDLSLTQNLPQDVRLLIAHPLKW